MASTMVSDEICNTSYARKDYDNTSLSFYSSGQETESRFEDRKNILSIENKVYKKGLLLYA